MDVVYQKLPVQKSEREKLRNKGQFWTPNWVAEAMVAYVSEGNNLVFDPAVGKGAFFTALNKINGERKRKVRFYGTDIDREIISEAKNEAIFDSELCQIEIRDFILDPPQKLFRAIVANPPYIRHHRLSPELKNHLCKLSLNATGVKLDRRAGLHIYFLIQALTHLENNGKLAFIMPADTCEGVFSGKLWEWITRKFRLESVITFASHASPFPRVDTNALIFLIRKARPYEKFWWIKCLKSNTYELKRFIESHFALSSPLTIEVHERHIAEGVQVGLSRPPQRNRKYTFRLSDFAKVMRGIATGANDFFFLTKEKAKQLRIPKEFLAPTIGRTRDVKGCCVTKKVLIELAKKGRPTLLFMPNGEKLEDLPKTVRYYLREGQKRGLHKKTLISTRNPWYRMERRKIPLFLFAYLGRRNTRFIMNNAKVLPLTSFLCVYPHFDNQTYVRKVWSVLQHSSTIANLSLVGKTYGAGAIKVEPRALENLPIDTELVKKQGLESYRNKRQLSLFGQKTGGHNT